MSSCQLFLMPEDEGGPAVGMEPTPLASFIRLGETGGHRFNDLFKINTDVCVAWSDAAMMDASNEGVCSVACLRSFFLPLAVHIEVHHGVLQQAGLLALRGRSHTSVDSHRICTCT